MAQGIRSYSVGYSVKEIITLLKQGKKLQHGGWKSSEDSDGYVTRWGFYINEGGQIEISVEEIIEIVTELTKV